MINVNILVVTPFPILSAVADTAADCAAVSLFIVSALTPENPIVASNSIMGEPIVTVGKEVGGALGA